MDWVERLVGFQEGSYADTKAKLAVGGERLVSKVNGRSYGIGRFDMVSLAELRQCAAAAGSAAGRPRVSIVSGDVGLTHQAPEYAGALFQVASQTNCLEMVGPGVTPEMGVTGYHHDRRRARHAPSQPARRRSTETTSCPSATSTGRPLRGNSMALPTSVRR